ncbi:MAG: MBL fold metallo-hydrolase [Actinomycetota bacterium]|nr:MBL fold metallo-hydrolase [Actinomycetota bacterium]
MNARIERVVTSGVFSLDGEDFDVDNNVWLVGNETEVLVIDAAHDAKAILQAIGGRDVVAVVLTHGHNDHLNAAGHLWDATRAPICLHPADRMLWDVVYPGADPDREIADGDVFRVAGTTLRIITTPGHSPGSVCLYAENLATVFTGDTLFSGGPGATGRSYSDHPTILASITDRLLVLPEETVVKTGHGQDTTIGAEAANLA